MAECKDCIHKKVCKFASVRVSVGTTVREIIHECSDHTPTADVAEVVRCKDCKHWNPFKAEYCRGNCENVDNGLFEFTKPDDFCSYGERTPQKEG